MEGLIASKNNPDTCLTQSRVHDVITKALDQEKLENIISIDLTGKSTIADIMIIATGRSARHIVATASKLREQLSAAGFSSRQEGTEGGDWVIVDAGDVVIHLFRPEVREFYNLEKLWATDFSTVGYNLYTTP